MHLAVLKGLGELEGLAVLEGLEGLNGRISHADGARDPTIDRRGGGSDAASPHFSVSATGNLTIAAQQSFPHPY